MSVRWLHMSLTGFGRFQSTTSVDWHDGVNVLVAPNESGKSTLMAGLAAILFGLPTSSNPDDFGQARYRNWHNPPAFEGILTFSADGTTYRLYRNFASHAVRVSVKTADGWLDQLTGEHNPRAHRPNVRYEEFLRATIGVASRELFTGTFALIQPLPEARQLDEQVQRLVSGAGTANYAEALKALATSGRRLSKFTKELGFSVRDAHNDGELEVVEKRIAELRTGIEASREAVDVRQTLQQQIVDLQKEIDASRGQLRETEAVIAEWSHWRDLRESHRSKLQEQSRLQRAWTAFHRLEAELETNRRRLLEEFPEMADVAADAGDALDELERTDNAVSAARRQLETEVAGLQQRADELQGEWRQFVADRDRLRSLDEQLKQEFTVFEEADELTQRRYATYEATKASLEGRVTHAEQRVARLEKEKAALEAARARFGETYGDLAELGDEAVDVIDQRIEQLASLEQWKAEYDRRSREYESTRRRRLGLGVAAAAAALIVAAAGTAFGVPIWIVSLTVLAGAAAAIGTALSLRRAAADVDPGTAAEQLRSVTAALAADERLGRWSDAPAHQLGALRERLAARSEAAAALADQETMSWSTEDDELVRRELAEANDAMTRFLESTAPGRRQFGDDLEEAYKRWQTLRYERGQSLRAVHSFSLRHFGVQTDDPEILPVADLPDSGVPAAWRSAAQLGHDAGLVSLDDGLTIGRVVDVLGTLSESRLDRVVAVRALAHADIVQKERRADALREHLAGVLAAANGDIVAAKRRWEQYQRRLGAIAGLQEQQAGVLAGNGVTDADELHERSLQAANMATDAYKELEQLVVRHPYLPPADEPLDGAALHAQLAELNARAEQLRRTIAEQERRLMSLSQRHAELVGEGVLNVAEAEEELEELECRREELALEVAAVALAHQELGLAAESYQQTHRERLAERTGHYWERFTGAPRRIRLDEQFGLSVLLPDGGLHSVSQLSQGARDQLYLAVRLAIADLVSDDVALPLLLDDPFVHCDDGRLQRIREALSAMAAHRQVILFSHRDVFSTWGREVSLRDGALTSGGEYR